MPDSTCSFTIDRPSTSISLLVLPHRSSRYHFNWFNQVKVDLSSSHPQQSGRLVTLTPKPPWLHYFQFYALDFQCLSSDSASFSSVGFVSLFITAKPNYHHHIIHTHVSQFEIRLLAGHTSLQLILINITGFEGGKVIFISAIVCLMFITAVYIKLMQQYVFSLSVIEVDPAIVSKVSPICVSTTILAINADCELMMVIGYGIISLKSSTVIKDYGVMLHIRMSKLVHVMKEERGGSHWYICEKNSSCFGHQIGHAYEDRSAAVSSTILSC